MDKQTFLTSGLLEQYVLGITDPEETQEVERHLNLYPELNQEVTAMRDAIKQYALQQDIPAPTQRTNEPSIASNTKGSRTYGQIHWLSVVVLGSLALLCVLSVLRLRNLQEENKTLLTQLSTCESREEIIAFLKDPRTQPVVLTETAANTEAAALVYWNKESKKAMLNPFNLPKLPQDKQYQIWVDVAGKMISIGLISTNLEKYQDLKYLDEATSLNITIEPLGGSSEPTVSRLVANHAI
ncbi:MAG: anti-sigma factor [Haliscomenobacter sp.]|uniref:anti-sigma factor n=1 Tax=Haliscomenobacter sp. TaxID=2717303 RepID=UPI0029A049CB|nr:anti-sigma factor [Haliscomenobacter sp.]MDX2069116.1 anti-sigma factor [Haliscomenobacter sp.]